MKDRILEVVKSALELDTIDDTCSQITCPKWDSLHHLSIVLAIECEFDLDLEPEQIAEMKSVNDIEKILLSITGE